MATRWTWYYCDTEQGDAYSREAAEVRLAEAIGCPLSDMVERYSCDDKTTYYYASEAEADADKDGAYAPQIREED